jgi:hypothetical protein
MRRRRGSSCPHRHRRRTSSGISTGSSTGAASTVASTSPSTSTAAGTSTANQEQRPAPRPEKGHGARVPIWHRPSSARRRQRPSCPVGVGLLVGVVLVGIVGGMFTGRPSRAQRRPDAESLRKFVNNGRVGCCNPLLRNRLQRPACRFDSYQAHQAIKKALRLEPQGFLASMGQPSRRRRPPMPTARRGALVEARSDEDVEDQALHFWLRRSRRKTR